jgi:hypothetical protein
MLIYINSRPAERVDGLMMLPPPPISSVRHCPVCGIAMVGSKSRKDLTKFDTYRCLTCDTTICEPPAQAPKEIYEIGDRCDPRRQWQRHSPVAQIRRARKM